MKRYAVIAWYQSTGNLPGHNYVEWEDVIGIFKSLKKAKECAKSHRRGGYLRIELQEEYRKTIAWKKVKEWKLT